MDSLLGAAHTLIIGYGNPDRQDDGVAWHVLCGLAERLGRPLPSLVEGFFPSGEHPDLWFVLQLTPELSKQVAGYEKVCFVDAHTGTIAEEIQVRRLEAQYQSSPLTHHMTPETCLALVDQLYGVQPEALLVSVKGEAFAFTHQLSPSAASRVECAIELIAEFSKHD